MNPYTLLIVFGWCIAPLLPLAVFVSCTGWQRVSFPELDVASARADDAEAALRLMREARVASWLDAYYSGRGYWITLPVTSEGRVTMVPTQWQPSDPAEWLEMFLDAERAR
jgi:hypothetical protein